MDEIHHFHETFLHPALVKCGHNLNEIGRVFLEYSDNFEIYSIYCRNSKKSEELRRILGRNAFLQSGIHELGAQVLGRSRTEFFFQKIAHKGDH